MDKDITCCWNCQLRTDDNCQLRFGDYKTKSIMEDAKPCSSWTKRFWDEETLSSNIGTFGDKKEYVNLKAKYPNSIFCFVQDYINYKCSYHNLLQNYEELKK